MKFGELFEIDVEWIGVELLIEGLAKGADPVEGHALLIPLEGGATNVVGRKKLFQKGIS